MMQNIQDVAKAVLKGKFIAIKLTSGNKKNLKKTHKPNVTPKGTRERRTPKPNEINQKDKSRNEWNRH